MILYYEKNLFKNFIHYYNVYIIENESPLSSNFSENICLTIWVTISP